MTFDRPTIVIEARDIYGQLKFYPKCAQAQVFADIAGTKTLSETNLRRIKKLGYLLDIERPTINLNINIGD